MNSCIVTLEVARTRRVVAAARQEVTTHLQLPEATCRDLSCGHKLPRYCSSNQALAPPTLAKRNLTSHRRLSSRRNVPWRELHRCPSIMLKRARRYLQAAAHTCTWLSTSRSCWKPRGDKRSFSTHKTENQCADRKLKPCFFAVRRRTISQLRQRVQYPEAWCFLP
uniref:Uncharacterized protein n=1 Tax=Peronospora matthiolae TaxID=2874970 RepID=A0AAV1TUU3_9STRA